MRDAFSSRQGIKPGLKSLLALLNAGNVSAAASLAERWRSENPNAKEALYGRALVYLVKAEYEHALPLLERVVTDDPRNALYRNNLGYALFKSARFDEAITHLHAAMTLRPDYAEAQYNLACTYLENRQPDMAAAHFKALYERFAQHAEYTCSYADALRAEGRWRDAVALYREVLAFSPDFSRAHGNLGVLLTYFGENDAALRHCRRAVELAPKQPLTHLNLGRCLFQNDALDDAMEAFADAYELDPLSADIATEIGWGWLAVAETAEASGWFQRALSLDESHEKAQAGLAQVMIDSGNAPAALELLASLAADEACPPEVLRVYANALWDDGDADAALGAFERLSLLQPHNAALFAQTAQILASSGDVDKAMERCEKGLELNPNSIAALHTMATTLRDKLEEKYVGKIESLLQRQELKEGAKSSLYNSLAYVYDGKKEYAKAADCMQRANEAQWAFKSRRGWDYTNETYARHCQQLKKTFNADYFEKTCDWGSPSEVPVFIVGMPRSGTTLTEQILARHPEVLGLGERNFMQQSFQPFRTQGDGDALLNVDTIDRDSIRRQADMYLKHLLFLKERYGKGDVTRIVDKMPDNYSLIGWILTLFPNAKIIHCRRNLGDVALSCWMTHFGKIQWANQWEHLEARTREYLSLIAHWKQTLPERFLEIDYERLVEDQEGQTRRMLAWIGVEWDPVCLDFHESDSLVRTASITQVREPIYKRSVERWRRYEPYFPALSAIVDEMKRYRGYEIDER